jgi:hypothetical protein
LPADRSVRRTPLTAEPNPWAVSKVKMMASVPPDSLPGVNLGNTRHPIYRSGSEFPLPILTSPLGLEPHVFCKLIICRHLSAWFASATLIEAA